MLSKTIGNVHHNKLPSIGAIVIIHVDDRRVGGSPAIGHRYRKFIVESYPGFLDWQVQWGIPFNNGHLVNIKALDNGWRTTVAGHWCEEI